MWEEGQTWGGHTGRERGGFKSQVTWNSLVGLVFVSRARSLENNSESAVLRNKTLHQHSLLQPWGFKEGGSQAPFKPDSVTRPEKEKER